MYRMLYITNIGGKKFSINFVGTALSAAKKLGIEFYVVANRNASTKEQIEADEKKYGVHLLHADINRSPFSFSNYKAYKQIVNYIKKYNIDYIHCNTPVGGVIGRLAGKKCGISKVIYQVHGFHFYKGAPLFNWLVYYPVERWLAHYTDKLVTINTEDYRRAQTFCLRNNGNVYYVPGVGIDTARFEKNEDAREAKRFNLGLHDDDVVLISAGELNANKNNKVIIEALSLLGDSKIHYLICGVGDKDEELKRLAKEKNIEGNVHFLGYRTDVIELFAASDIFVMPSFREGLSRSIMEAMASGLPCIVSKIRGNTDLIKDGIDGYTCDPKDSCDFARSIKELCANKELRARMGNASKQDVKQFSTEKVVSMLLEIYKEIPSEKPTGR